MRQVRDIAGALRWAGEARNRNLRAARFTAWQVATSGPACVDGCTTIPAAAKARDVPVSTMYSLLAHLETHYALTGGKCDALTVAPAPHRIPSARIEDEANDLDELLGDPWNPAD